MTIKSETMRRMDAMRTAGLAPDMTITIDTVAVRNSQMVMIRNPKWIALYEGNPHVRAAYDADVDLSGFFAQSPTIIANVTPAPAPLVDSFKRDETAAVPPTLAREPFIDVTPVPKTPVVPMAEETLVNVARRMAEDLRDPHANNVPDHAHLAWLLDRLADRIEAKEKETHGDPDEHQA